MLKRFPSSSGIDKTLKDLFDNFKEKVEENYNHERGFFKAQDL
jgi:hypothetical protein